MKIKLTKIPADGESWSVNQKTGELNQALRDLIGPCNYQIEFTIRPMDAGATYDFTGKFKTELSEQCSRCGLDFKLPVDSSFHHLLMPALEIPRDAKFSKVNHFSDLNESQLDVAEYSGEEFEVGEFFHELIALAEPYSPAPEVDKKGNCLECKIPVQNQNFGYDESLEGKITPFVTLKGVKFNS